jgi:hypothetical protein
MKKILLLVSISLLLMPLGFSQSISSIRNRLGNAMVDKAVDNVMGNEEKDKPNQESTQESEKSGKPDQNEGGGLEAEDVTANLDKASTQYDAKAYKDAKLSLKNALKVIEMKIAEQLLASLPETVKDLPAEKANDKVNPSGSNMAGFNVHREYKKGDLWSAITIYNGSMATLTNSAVQYGAQENTNQKSIRVKNRDAVITFDSSEGYTISISSGQQTNIIIEGVNIKSESEMIAIATSFDYDNIDKLIGDK